MSEGGAVIRLYTAAVKYYHLNIVKVATVKVVIVQIGPFQNNIYDMFYND